MFQNQGKEDLSCGRQGIIPNLNTLPIENEKGVNVRLSLCEPIDSLPYIDNLFVESVDTLVDPIDNRSYSSSKINFFQPSVDTYAFILPHYFVTIGLINLFMSVVHWLRVLVM